MPFDPVLAKQIHAAAVPIAGTQILTPNGANALRRLIATIQAAPRQYGHSIRGSLSPIQLLAKLGSVHSIQFLGIESRGLEVTEATPVVHRNPRNSQESQWELYKVTQQGGVSEWLIEVTRNGAIRNAQAVTCATSCPGF